MKEMRRVATSGFQGRQGKYEEDKFNPPWQTMISVNCGGFRVLAWRYLQYALENHQNNLSTEDEFLLPGAKSIVA